jgi:hypothetical protein
MSGTSTRKPGRHGGDKRGSAASRRARKLWFLSDSRWDGDGERCRCAHWTKPGLPGENCLGWVTFETVEADRIIPGGAYARSNVQPSCKPCNQARSDDPTWVATRIQEVA